MKRYILALFLAFFSFCGISAQNVEESADTLSFNPSVLEDSTLSGCSIEGVMPVNVTIKQTFAVRAGLDNCIERNKHRMFNGFRVRIFYDNSQSARSGSEKALADFHEAFPDIAAYRSFTNTYFKVVVGDFRTKIEAQAVLDKIADTFPDALVIKEKFKYPALP